MPPLSDEHPDDGPRDLRETYRQQLIAGIGGWQGTVIAAVPTVVFIIVNATSTLRWAIVAAVGSAVVLAVYRLARHQSAQQALTGLIGVVVAAAIAARTGQARGYFLLGIWSSFVYGAVFLGSMAVRRPIVGLAWEFLDPTPPDGVDVADPGAETGEGDGPVAPPWHRRPVLLRAYLLATLGGTVVFLARGIVQLALFAKDATGWLAFARIAMGYPLYIAAVGFGFWVVSRARRRLAADRSTATGPDPAHADPTTTRSD